MTEQWRTNRAEVLLVLGVSPSCSAVYALVDLVGELTAGEALSSQTTTLNPSQAAGHPWLDLALQLVQISPGMRPSGDRVDRLPLSGKCMGSKQLEAGKKWVEERLETLALRAGIVITPKSPQKKVCLA